MQNPKYREPEEDFDEDEDWYDANSNPTPGGMYDAGGHLDGERAAERADWLRDYQRDQEQ